MINYPETLTYWQNHTPLLKHSISKFLGGESNFDEQELNSIKGYIKHWIEYDGHEFERESDRQILLIDLSNCKSTEDIECFLEILLDFGIDPF